MPRKPETNAAYMREYRARKRAEKRQEAVPAVVGRPVVKPQPVAARRGAGAHRKAVTRMLRSTGLLHVPEEAPLVELVKALADDMDAGGGSRTQGAYIAALRDVRKVLAISARPKSSPDVPAPVQEETETEPAAGEAAPVNSLAEFRQARGIG